MSKSIRFAGIAVAASAAIFLASCGGGGSTGGMTPSTATGTDFAKLNATNAGYAASAAARAADARPSSGSITQSSNTVNGVTVDRVNVAVTYGAGGRHGYVVEHDTDWSISSASGDLYYDREEGVDFVELQRRVSGGTLYVDVYSDIEAPSSRPVGSSDDGTRDVPLGTRVFTGNVSGSSGSVSGLSGSLNGASGTFACTGGCTYSGGITTGGTWTFTPDRPPGAISISGGSGVAFTGQFNPARTPGTYNGQTGYFRCLSISTTGCGQSTSNGRLSLQGQWIFVPAGGTTVSTPDTDYLAGGVWLFVPDNATSADDVVFGAFGDGNDPFRQSNLTALRGTARYTGGATGVYTDRSENEVGYWDADTVSLTADFGGTSDLGTIGGYVEGFEDWESGERYAGRMNLGRTSIGSSNSGFFEGRLSGSVAGTALTGRWGGQFFGNSETDGKPGSVGGTLGGTSADRSASFVGVFGAYKQ